MRLTEEITLLFLLSLVWIKKIHCEKPSEESKWTCICSAGNENQGFILPANCSTSCSCSQGGSSADGWTCICASDGFPKVNSSNSNTSCFTACTCKFGTPTEKEIEYPKKQVSREVVLVILVLCIVVTVLALVASALCYFNRRDKYPIQRPLFLSGKELSINSSTNLMSRVTSSAADYNDYITSSSNNCTGCIDRVPFLSRNRTGLIHGTILQFSYSELESATKSFSQSNLIGIGGSSHVYRGYLKDGRTVAIKRIKTKGGADVESLFLTEIKLIARLHHCHVVPLLGYCSSHHGKNAERLLVFEYMSNGNLRDCLDGDSRKCLDWETRIVVALGAAKGLEYLHESAAPKILHRDVKSTNILLNEKWRPKITDLGLAKHLLSEGAASGSSSPARMQGTFGYFAPEYANVGRVSQKSDVFSFGVVLLELITGRQPIFKCGTKGEESLVIWATPRLQDSMRVIRDLPDPFLEGTYQDEEMQVMAYLAKECLVGVTRLRKLIMLSNSGRLRLEHVRIARREFGLPDDFELSVVLKYPRFFRLFDGKESRDKYIEVVERDPGLAVCAIEGLREREYREKGVDAEDVRFSFIVNFPPGFKIGKYYKIAVWKWQRLPYWSPYEDVSGFDLRSLEAQRRMEKRAIAMIHELLSLTVEKKITLERIAHFRMAMNLPSKLKDFLLQHQGIFYISTRGNHGKLHTVFLREAYKKGELVEPNDLYLARRKLADLVLTSPRKAKMDTELVNYRREGERYRNRYGERGYMDEEYGDHITEEKCRQGRDTREYVNSDLEDGSELDYTDEDNKCHEPSVETRE